ncbi:DNA polymerase kappa [Camellia lanceoleosa]|uniref:DNA polymerase kappa n=1 Tax=Camellia lanceoleosa TaxID=1840588 RepID=A0ACC0F905_9ERIC|nr:DNA polymerase kappa [Camellia lanceoleosa]
MVCSDINKPNGQFILPNDRMAVMTFISSLPMRKIGGIGKVTEHLLRDVFGITTCEEMLQKSGILGALFSPSSADDGREDLMRLFDGSQEATKKAQEEVSEHVRCLEEDLGKLSTSFLLMENGCMMSTNHL